MKLAEALSSVHTFGVTSKLGRNVPSKLGSSLKVALRSLLRETRLTRQAVLCITAVITLATVGFAGGLIANQTTQSYVERAICKDVILVGHPDVLALYTALLSRFREQDEVKIPAVNPLEAKYVVPDSIVSRLEGASGVIEADPRLVLEDAVYEVPEVIIDPEEPGYYVQVGDHRSGRSVIVGLDPKSTIGDWLVTGRFLSENDEFTAVVGDSLALSMFSQPQKQSIKILGKNFKIVGICFDPLNRGKVTYVPMKTLSEALGNKSCNIVLLKVGSASYQSTLTRVQEALSGTRFEMAELNPVLKGALNFVNNSWSPGIAVDFSSTTVAVLCLVSFVMLSVARQRREFGIVRTLGAKPRTILKMVFVETFLIVLVGNVFGIPIGLTVTFLFLIPEPVLSAQAIILLVGWIAGTTFLLPLLSLYPARRAARISR